MGDICNMNDVERFLRSREGRSHLKKICASFKGRTIADVSFSNEVCSVGVTLHMDDGSTVDICDPSLDVDELRYTFSSVLRREYLADYA